MEKVEYEYSEDGLNLSKLTRKELRQHNKKSSRKEPGVKTYFKHSNLNNKDVLELLNIWNQYGLPKKEFITLDEL